MAIMATTATAPTDVPHTPSPYDERVESDVKRRPRAATWWSRFVLAAALFVGIVLMHVLGHPGEHADSTHVSGGHVAAAMEHVVADAGHATAPAPAHGAGVAAVCLAVLGAGIGILLAFRGALVRRRRRAAAPSAMRLAYALCAIPPPESPQSLLTRFSLLRI
ncbi:hypothetical protein DEJ46_06465 [Streptomyces venezuelae]|uniref:Uncharacterized protein n=1 Tax=Streptomyces venezuelae TaxID=54571 RepID=A0A5P2APJ2_STRVZ|nr:hypothetical protein DEJ46_06465 [Streptomyces venezuelae]